MDDDQLAELCKKVLKDLTTDGKKQVEAFKDLVRGGWLTEHRGLGEKMLTYLAGENEEQGSDEESQFQILKEVVRRGLLPDHWAERDRELLEHVLELESSDEFKMYLTHHAEDLSPDVRSWVVKSLVDDMEMSEERRRGEEEARVALDAALADIQKLREENGNEKFLAMMSESTPAMLNAFFAEQWNHNHPIQAIYFALNMLGIPLIPDKWRHGSPRPEG